MSTRFFTADWHLNHSNIIKYSRRPFKDYKRMNEVLIKTANSRAKPNDIIIHVGDFYCRGSDRGSEINEESPDIWVNKINAGFFNVKGNHDVGNDVLSLCDVITTKIGPFTRCFVSHFPSNDPNSKIKFLKNIINICGHVHKAWKYYYDVDRNILNINVGVDVWKYNIVSESELIDFIINLGRNDKKIQALLDKRYRKFYK